MHSPIQVGSMLIDDTPMIARALAEETLLFEERAREAGRAKFARMATGLKQKNDRDQFSRGLEDFGSWSQAIQGS